jgi:hypothetical protein
VILEGRVHEPDDVRRAFELGVYAVVVGTAITDFEWLSRRFIVACPKSVTGRAGSRFSRTISRGHDTSRPLRRKQKS